MKFVRKFIVEAMYDRLLNDRFIIRTSCMMIPPATFKKLFQIAGIKNKEVIFQISFVSTSNIVYLDI